MQLLKVLARVLEYPTEELQQSKDALVAAVLEDSRLPRQNNVEGKEDLRALEECGLTKAQADEMYRYLAIANYEDRFVIPTSHRELAKEAFPDATAYGERGGCGFSFGDGCNGGDSDFSLFGGKKQTTSMVSKLATVKQVDPKQLQD